MAENMRRNPRNKESGAMGGSVLLTLFFAVFVGVGLVVLGFGARAWHFAKLAESWPTVPGAVVASSLDVSSDSEGTTYEAKVSYKYAVMGREFTGEKIAFGYTGSSGRKYHDEIRDALPAGAQVAVRYDPAAPERAVLSFGVNRSIIFFLIFGAIWTVFTGGIAALFFLTESGAGALLQNMIIYSRN